MLGSNRSLGNAQLSLVDCSGGLELTQLRQRPTEIGQRLNQIVMLVSSDCLNAWKGLSEDCQTLVKLAGQYQCMTQIGCRQCSLQQAFTSMHDQLLFNDPKRPKIL